MRQEAPDPQELAELVEQLSFREHLGWSVVLRDMIRDAPRGGLSGSAGLTLVVTRCRPDSYHHENMVRVAHYFPVPPATYDRRSWQRWLFNRLGDVDTHERMEDFLVDGVRPYAPSHGPGNDPYLVREVGTVEDAETSFRGVRAGGTQG